MLLALFWCIYALAAALCLFRLSAISPKRVQFNDGVLLGAIYFVLIPLFFVLLNGEISADFVDTGSYVPLRDHATTFLLLFGMIFTCVLHWVLRAKHHRRPNSKTDHRLLWVLLSVLAVCEIYAWAMSGIAGGGHWYRATMQAMRESPSLLFVKHIADVFRTTVFGVLLYWSVHRRMSRQRALLVGLVVCVVDIMLTFNRITVAYELVLAIILFRDRRLHQLGILCSVSLLIPISNSWPLFRGLVSEYGYTPAGMMTALEVTVDRAASADNFTESMNGVFESSSMVVLNRVVQDAGGNQPYLLGDMFIRPVTFWVPRSVWPSRPDVFATTLGSRINGTDEISLSSTIFGESFANFGPFWFLALGVLLSLYEFGFRMLSRRCGAAGYMGAIVGFAMWRFDAVFGALAVGCSFALIEALQIFSSMRRRKRGAPQRPHAATDHRLRPVLARR